MTAEPVLDRPVICGKSTDRGICCADAFGPPGYPRCADHGGPDLLACESCRRTITDDAERFDCPAFSGPVHVGCHPADCRSAECREALSEPGE